MVRTHFNQPVINTSTLALVTDATIRILQPGTTTPITAPIYQNKTGGTTRSQGWAATNGYIDFYLDLPQTVRIGVTRAGQSETYIEDKDVGAVVMDTSTTDKGVIVLAGDLAGTAASPTVPGKVPTSLSVLGSNSILGGGTLTQNRTFALDGDALTPGANKYYGTNGSGVKGFYVVPTGSGDASSLITSVKTYGAMGDGTTDDSAAIQAAIDAMIPGGVLYFPAGIYIISTTIFLPAAAGATLTGPAPAPINRLGAAVIKAKNGSNLIAMMAGREWFNSVASGGTADAASINVINLTFYGGGWLPQTIHDTEIETTSNTQYGLVMHGSAFKIRDIFICSTNSHGLVIAGNYGRDTTTLISEVHEGWISDSSIRYSGGDGFHAMPGAEDCEISRTKIVYAGGHGFYIDDNCGAWDIHHNHPSRCGLNMFHCESSWEVNLSHNYIDALGDFMDKVAIPGRGATDTRYGIYMNGGNANCAHIDHNRMHTESSGGQQEKVVGLFLKGWVLATYNSLIYKLSDVDVSMTEIGGTLPAQSENVGNHAFAGT